MNFVSYSYAILFTIVLTSRLTIGRNKTEAPFVAILIVASAVLYAWHVPMFLLILLTSAVVDFLAGVYLGRNDEPGSTVTPARRKLVLLASLAVNLGLLFYFKYTDFAIRGARRLFRQFGLPVHWDTLDLILPMGISFYTFATLSYTIDVYRREIPPVRRFWKFLLFISFFPHLVAGPIVRASMFLPQIDRKRRPRLRVFNQGLFLIIRGLFLKMVCADNLAKHVNALWSAGSPIAPADSWALILASLFFACQIFCDFEGYSSVAQGTAYLLGYRLPLNFNNPYLAGTFRNFWQRWHITLSEWLRDYLYIPLGGNRGTPLRTYINLMIVMLLGGLWHGAAPTFVAWGALHGLALAVERLLGLSTLDHAKGKALARLAWYLVVQATVMVTWILFRSLDLGQAFRILKGIAAGRFSHFPRETFVAGAWFALPIVVVHLRGLAVERKILPPSGPLEKAVLAGAMLFAILTLYGEGSAFIYFQF